MALLKTLKEYPALKILEARTVDRSGENYGLQTISCGQTFVLSRKGYCRLGKYTVGSVWDYAIRNNEDPAKAEQKAIERGEPVVYACQNATVLSSEKREQDVAFLLNADEKVVILGRVFTIKRTANNNVSFVPVTD